MFENRLALAVQPDFITPLMAFPGGTAIRVRFVGGEVALELGQKVVRHPWIYARAPFVRVGCDATNLDIEISDDGTNWITIHRIVGNYPYKFPKILLNWRE